MANPTIQFKRGQAANVGLASFKAGEPGFTTDKYDFYIGLDGTHTNQKFFGSSRYWGREDGTSAAQLKFVDKDGSNSINFQAPNTLSGIATWILPAHNAGTQDEFLKITSASGNQITLDWAAVPSGSFTIAADSGSDDTFTTGQTLTFAGGEGVDTTVTDNQISIAAEIATATNAGIASFPASAFYFTGSGGQVGVVTATSSVKGVASFDSTDFTVTNGDVAINDEYVQDIAGGMFTGNTETGITATYQDDDGTVDLEVSITTSEIAANTLVIESEGIGSNDNDTTIPTSAAVKDYVDNNTPASTVDINGDTGTASVSTGSTFAFTGTDPVVIAASGAGVTFSISDAAADGSTKGIAAFDTDDFDASSGVITLGDSANGAVLAISATNNETTVSRSNGTVTIGLPDDVTIGQDLTVTRNLYVNGSTTQVNVDALTVDDPLIAVGTTSGGAPSADFAKDLGILMHYYSSGAKLASVYWDNSEGRMVMASVATESSNVLTATTRATVEIGSLMLSDAAGTAESVITVSGSDRILENIIVDAGTF